MVGAPPRPRSVCANVQGYGGPDCARRCQRAALAPELSEAVKERTESYALGTAADGWPATTAWR